MVDAEYERRVKEPAVRAASSRLRAVVAAMVLLASFIPAPRALAQSRRPAVRVSPVTYDLRLSSMSQELTPLKVENIAAFEEKITVEVAGLTQGLRGAARFLEDENARRSAAVLTADPAEFNLAAGRTREVRLRVNGTPADERSIYAAVMVKAVPVDEVEDAGASRVSSAARVGVVMELASPSPGAIDGDVTGMLIEEVPDGRALTEEERQVTATGGRLPYRVNLAPIVLSKSAEHFKPTGFVVVRNEAGGETGRPGLAPENVLPGCRRAVTCAWAPGDSLPDGAYLAEAHVWIGAREHVRSEQFLMIGGRLARKMGKIRAFTPNTVEPEKPFTLKIKVENTGRLAFTPVLRVKVLDEDRVDEVIGPAGFRSEGRQLEAGQGGVIEAGTAGSLKDEARYRVQVTMSCAGEESGSGEIELDSFEGVLSVKSGKSWLAVLWNWITWNWWWMLLVVCAATAGIVIFLLARKNRRLRSSLGYNGMAMPVYPPVDPRHDSHEGRKNRPPPGVY